ncbi:MAG: hypothetical protein J5679_01220 [Alphaproteobacteria bacterium]|nr:hypothetical protein [Alphaproteobacteria bacterium]
MRNNKYKVTLDTWGTDPNKGKIASDSSLTEKEAKEYKKELLAALKHAPKTSCLLCLEAAFSKTDSTIVSFNRTETNSTIDKTHSNNLELHLATRLHCTDTERKCLRNIKEGKCPDVFVAELIGKKFFAKEKQK